jgi:two-component system, NtrC family, response regulator AtoC
LDTGHTNNDAIREYVLALRSLDLRRSRSRIDALINELINKLIIGDSTLIVRAKKLLCEAGISNSTVLITGETGTGKEPAACAIHYSSDRRQREFVKMNCAVGPEQLIEDELFGHVRGAFTGAHSARAGRFEQADGGTLLLDEIGDMSLNTQAKLLRVLQEREFERLGSSHTIKVDTRIIAATNRDLKKAIREGQFRADLYYRLAIIEISLPPLRDRRSDIPLLVPYILGKKQESAGWKQEVLFTPKGLKIFCEHEYDWPGNVRELENKIERLGTSAAAADGLITEDAVLEMFASDNSDNGRDTNWQTGISADSHLLEQERALYRKILAETKGNKSKAAHTLGLKRSTLRSRLKQLEEHSNRRWRR